MKEVKSGKDNIKSNKKNTQRKSKTAVSRPNQFVEGLRLPQKVVMQIADEVAKVVTARLKKTGSDKTKDKPIVKNPIFLDTSAIIDTRIFDLIKIGVFTGTFVILESVLSELKAIADSKDDIKKERGRKGLKLLDQLKKMKNVGMIVLKDDSIYSQVDDKIVNLAKEYKGKIITCDYNLSKKATITGVASIDIYELASLLKTPAVPGETFKVKLIQKGKTEGQGVGYLPDGTMIVVEEGETLIGKSTQVIVSRIIQTEAGKIFFAKIVSN